MERQKQREYFSVVKQVKPNEIINSRLLAQYRTRHIAPILIGRSQKNIKDIEKIMTIKQKCLQDNYRNSEVVSCSKKEKSYSVANEEDLDTSCIMTDEEDNAELEPQTIKGTILYKSKFNNRPSTILFRYPSCCEKEHNERNLQERGKIIKGEDIQMFYRIYGSEYKCIVNAFEFNGFKKTDNLAEWIVFFDVRGSKIKSTHHKMVEGQKFNHFAGCWYLGRKDQLWKAGYKLHKSFPQDYNFLPKTYLLPSDYQRFQTVRQLSDKQHLWIKKPVASSKGRNIKVFSNNTRIQNRRNILISQYIANPHLINNLKYDLRIYVLVTSFNPLRIYIYENGLARFATGQYQRNGKKKDKFVHLTNFSVNKYSKNFVNNKKSDNTEDQYTSKWSLFKLRDYYSKNGIDHQKIFKQVEDIVIKTCISGEPNILSPKFRHQDKRTCSFELFGFDILIDDTFKAWLMEVNVCPSLCSSSPFDRKIKHTLIVDLLNLIGVSQPENLEPKTLKQQPRRYKFKNPGTILNLNFENCLQVLDPQDWLILFQHEQQMDRMSLGSFSRAFPRKDNITSYQRFFECPRYNNFVLWKHMLSSRSFIDKLKL